MCSHYKGAEGTFWHPPVENITQQQLIAIFAAGPLAGATAGYTMMSAIEMYERIKNKESFKKIISASASGPFLLMKKYFEEAENVSFKSPVKSALTVFLLSMIASELMNLLPLHTNCDGYQICKALNVSPSLLSITTKIGKFFEL